MPQGWAPGACEVHGGVRGARKVRGAAPRTAQRGDTCGRSVKSGGIGSSGSS